VAEPLDAQANVSCRPESDIASHTSRGRIFIIATREDLTMLREVIKVIERQG
jgi:hypothetical protein